MLNKAIRVKVLLACSCFILASCGQKNEGNQQIPLVIAVPHAMYGPAVELQHDLIQLFAHRKNIPITTRVIPNHLMISALQRKEVQLIAAPLRRVDNTTNIIFAPSYQRVNELLICHRDADEQMEKLVLNVVAGSSQEAALETIKPYYPDLNWQTTETLSAKRLLEQVALDPSQCAITSEPQFKEAWLFNPQLHSHGPVALPSELAWALPISSDRKLIGAVNQFFNDIKKDGTLKRLLERYYGFYDRLDETDTTAFIRRSRTQLPKYRHLFRAAGMVTEIDWRLLAALGYQESQWNPKAVSHSHVKGMMMLTRRTAKQMGVSNRLDSEQSIFGGAKYLLWLKARIPKEVPEPDKTWFALASYNQGYYSLNDARTLTRRAGDNPNSWADVKKHMPLLSQAQYYQTVPYGYARGGEAVVLVERVRSFYHMLQQLSPQAALDHSFSSPPR